MAVGRMSGKIVTNICSFDPILNKITRYKEWLEKSKIAERMDEEDEASDDDKVVKKGQKSKRFGSKIEVYGSMRNKGELVMRGDAQKSTVNCST